VNRPPAQPAAAAPALALPPPSPVLGALVTLFLLAQFIPQAVYFTVGPLQFTPARTLSILLFPLLAFGRRIRWAWPDLLMLGPFLVTFVSIVRHGGTGVAVEWDGRMFLDVGVAYLVGRCVAGNLAWFARTMRMLTGLLAVFGVMAFVEAAYRFNVHLALWGVVANVGGVFEEQRMGLFRARGWTTHPIMHGLVYATFLPLAVQAALDRTGVTGRFARLKVAGLVAGTIFCMSSGVWIAASVAVLLLAYDRLVRIKAGVRWGAFFVGAPLTYVLLEVVANRPLLRILMMKMHISSPDAWQYRWRLNQRVLDQMPGNWPLGWGLHIPDEFTQITGWSIDNHFLVLILMTGVIGLSAWIVFMLGALLFRARYVWFGNDGPLPRTARTAGFALLGSVAAQFSVALYSTAHVVLWLIMGVGVSLAMMCAQPPPPPRAGQRRATAGQRAAGQGRAAPRRGTVPAAVAGPTTTMPVDPAGATAP